VAITYEPIATTTLGSNAATITFSSISSSYTDLRLVFLPLSIAGGSTVNARLTFNGDTNTNYSQTIIYGDGTSVASTRFPSPSATEISLNYFSNMGDSNTPGLIQLDIFSYAGSTNKTLLWSLSNDKNGSGWTQNGVGLWRSTSAITSLTLTSGGTYRAGVTATLYGILKN